LAHHHDDHTTTVSPNKKKPHCGGGVGECGCTSGDTMCIERTTKIKEYIVDYLRVERWSVGMNVCQS
jgi:hypothetical protein